MVIQPSQCLKLLIMVYANSTGAVDRRRYVNIDHRTACAGKLHALAMRRLTSCWFAKEADSAEVVRRRLAGNCLIAKG